MVFAPASCTLSLDGLIPTTCTSRNSIPDQTKKQFLKTAKTVAEAPWKLTRAQDYLKDLVTNNSEQLDPTTLPTINFIKLGAQELEAAPPESSEFQKWAPGTPKVVSVQSLLGQGPAKRRRISSKSSGPHRRCDPPGNGQHQAGCSKCRWSRNGCAKCRQPKNQPPRGPWGHGPPGTHREIT